MLNETVETKQEGQRVAGLGILKHDGQNFSKNWILILPIEAVWEWRAALFLLHAAKGLLLGFTGGRHLGLRLVLHLFGDPGEQWRQEGWNDGTTTTQSRKAPTVTPCVKAAACFNVTVRSPTPASWGLSTSSKPAFAVCASASFVL